MCPGVLGGLKEEKRGASQSNLGRLRREAGKSRDSKGPFRGSHPPDCGATGGSRVLGAGGSYVGRGVSQHGTPRQLDMAGTSSVRGKRDELQQVSGTQGQKPSPSPCAAQRRRPL